MIPALNVIAAADAGSDMLTPDVTLLIVLALFIVFVPILNRLLFKPIIAVLQERERLTGGSSDEARAMVLTVEQRLAEYEEGIREAREKGLSDRNCRSRKDAANVPFKTPHTTARLHPGDRSRGIRLSTDPPEGLPLGSLSAVTRTSQRS